MQTDGVMGRSQPRSNAWVRGGTPATLNLAGLRLPLLETAVVVVASFVLLVEWYHTLLPFDDHLLARGLERALLYGLVPLAALLLLRQHPGDYGLRLGEWRVGLLAAAAAAAVATPVILVASSWPDVHAYYRQESVEPVRFALANVLDVGAAEFLFRGFLMMALVRWCGPLGVVLATFPFVFVHLGKPELEALSTVITGIGFGWLAWRTRSILYGALLHVYILTLVMVAASL
ncbi:MAG: lysostaphin resistance A-like protein [Candidatus Limnocylindria bacterium]